MKVIVIGGGFAGLNLAKRLAGDKDIEVTLADRNNYHFFPPLLYQVSTAFIEASNISYPFRRMFQHKKVKAKAKEPSKKQRSESAFSSTTNWSVFMFSQSDESESSRSSDHSTSSAAQSEDKICFK